MHRIMVLGLDMRKIILSAVLAPAILITGGCAQMRQKKAISLYVDAMILNDQQESSKAVDKLIEAVELDPEFAMAYSLQGDIFQQAGRYEKSADAYEAATKLDPWSFRDFFNLGKVSQVIKQFARAAKAYSSACELKPGHYESHIGAAKSYFEIKDYSQAFVYGSQAKAIDPNSAEAELVLGWVFDAEQRYSDSISSYRRALEIQGNQPKIMVALAVAYLRTDQYEAAKELLDAVIGIDSANGPAYQYMGYILLKLKNADQAVESYEKAVAIDPGDWAAHKGLGVAYMLRYMNGKKDTSLKQKAMEHWNTSMKLNPQQDKLQELIDKYSKQ